MIKTNSISKINELKNEKIGIITHFGLGDHIILNGLINFLSIRFKEIHLIIEDKLEENLSYLYKQNHNVILHKISNPMKLDRSIDHSYLNEVCQSIGVEENINFLELGFDNVGSEPFNLAFYSQINLPYSYSLNNFSIPENMQEPKQLLKHLKSYFKIKNEFILVHNESSLGTFDLYNIENKKDIIYVTKESDLFNNIFFYSEVIKEAKEIHCLDSSFLHLVERLKTNADLYFHDLFIASVKLTKNWNYIYYYDKN
tara:strand:- start:90 stop:857 length:768 start_codon:yes stop_codon:yes gene_type:complete